VKVKLHQGDVVLGILQDSTRNSGVCTCTDKPTTNINPRRTLAVFLNKKTTTKI
jgi:hypothetical protein